MEINYQNIHKLILLCNYCISCFFAIKYLLTKIKYFNEMNVMFMCFKLTRLLNIQIN